MRVAPDERSRTLHDGEEAREVVNFSIGVSAVHDTREVEKVGALVQLSPQPPLQSLFGVLEGLRLPEKIEMCKDTEDVSWHTCRSEDVQELHSLHFEAKIGRASCRERV